MRRISANRKSAKHCLKKGLFLFVVGSCFLSAGITASSYTTYSLNYPNVAQQQTQWCWAACSLMSGKYVYPSSTKTQSQIVQYIKGSVVNQPGSLTETASAARFVTNNTRTYHGAMFTFPKEWFISQVVNNKVPILGTECTSANVGHMVSFKKVVIYDTGSSTITFVNPATGSTQAVSLYNLMNGFTYNGSSYVYKWTATVYC